MSSAKPSNPLAPFYPDIGAPSATYSTEGLEPLSYELDPAGDGKSVKNHPRPDGKLSPFYDTMWQGDGNPNSKAWADFHIYHQVGTHLRRGSANPQPNNPNHVQYAHKLYEAVRREFPELRVYRVSRLVSIHNV
jgi:DOPA 4,5-dioxygenase